MVGRTFTFEKLLPSNEKVCQVDFHPVLNWLASYDRNDYLTVWDWEKAEVILECQIGSSLANWNRQEVDFHVKAESDPSFFGKSLGNYVAATYLVGQAFGRVRSARFFDLDTIYWSSRSQSLIKSGPAASQSSVQHLGKIADRRFLLIVCDKAVLVYDLLNKRVQPIPCSNPQLNGKPFLEAVMLLRDEKGAILSSPHIAVACTDGMICVIDTYTQGVARVLRQGSGKEPPVTCMAVIPQFKSAGDCLFVGDEKGTVTVYKPTRLEAEYPTVLKSHNERILQILYTPGPEHAGPAPVIVTVGADSRVCCYDTKLMQTFRSKPLDHFKHTKITGACLALSGPTATQDSMPIILATNQPSVYAYSPLTGTARRVVNLEPHLPARTDKKAAKCYAIAGNLLCPDVVGVATNGGIAIIRTDASPAFSVAGLCESVSFNVTSTADADALLISADDGFEEVSNMRAASFVSVLGSDLVGTTFMAQSDPMNHSDSVVLTPGIERAAVNSAPLSTLQTSRLVLTKLQAGHTGASVHTSPDGTMVAVCWPHDLRYSVHGRSGGSVATQWKVVDEGIGSAVQWHHSKNWLAVLVRPHASSPGSEAYHKKAYKNMSKDEIMEMRMRIVANEKASAHAGAYVTVRALSVSEPSLLLVSNLTIPGMNASGDQPISGLHGGLLLGVSVTQAAADPKLKQRWLLLHDWSGNDTGIRVPEPLWVSYSPACEYAALGYADGVDVVHLSTTFEKMTRIGVRRPQSAIWNDLQLYIATDVAVFVAFVVPPAEDGNQLTQRTNLFSHTGGDSLPALSSLATASATEVSVLELATVKVNHGRDLRTAVARTQLPALCIRPGSNSRIVSVTDDVLWMSTSHGDPCAISLSHAGIKCRQLASGGDLVAARKLAQTSLHPDFHNDLAIFLSAFGLDGVAEGLLLPGLSLELELELAIKCGALKRGCACLAALLAGCQDRTLLGRFAAWNNRDIDPDAASREAAAAYNESDPFAILDMTVPELVQRTQIATDVMAVFKEAAGVAAPSLLTKLPMMGGVQGRATPIDADLFTSAPDGDSPTHVAKSKAPPPSTYKPMFPRATQEAAEVPTSIPEDGQAAGFAEEYADVIDWDWPLRAIDAVAEEAKDEGEAAEGDEKKTGEGEVEEGEQKSEAPATVGANVTAPPRALELGIQLLDAGVAYADAVMLSQTIQLMAPHTGSMTAAQQQRLVAAVGACGLASQLADLTLSGTTPLMPASALLAGFLSGDARVTARVLEKEGLLPLRALFMQSCGVGGLEASMQWETELQGLLGGPTRTLIITPNTA